MRAGNQVSSAIERRIGLRRAAISVGNPLCPTQALQLPQSARAWSGLMTKRNVEKLIAEWKVADLTRRRTVPDRGYNASYSNPDIGRQRASDEADAAARLALQILTAQKT